MASSAVGRLAHAVEGAVTRATLAQLGLEVLTFTAVSRTLSSAAELPRRCRSLLDVALNAGLRPATAALREVQQQRPAPNIGQRGRSRDW
jgi:hypothetical protein